MMYLTMNEFTWNLSLIVFCVFSVAALFGVVTVLKKGFFLYSDKRWQQISLRLCFTEAVVAMLVLSYPKTTAPVFDLCCAYSIALMCTALGAFMVYVAMIYATILLRWIFEKV